MLSAYVIHLMLYNFWLSVDLYVDWLGFISQLSNVHLYTSNFLAFL